MSIRISPVIAVRERGEGTTFSTRSLDVEELGDVGSPVVVLDDFRVRGRPFGPHPHAGFSAVTYVFEDSKENLRTRDSLGDDLVVGPGGIVWTQAGSGVLHEEIPAEPGRELHGLQVFVNLSSRNKLVTPRLFQLASSDVPEWRSAVGDRVRVAVGSFEGVSSPLVPVEPFQLLDVELRRAIPFSVETGRVALAYVVAGEVLVRAEGGERKVSSGHAVALHGGGGRAAIEGSAPAHLVLLTGPELREPVAAQGPFIMNEPSQLRSAFERYRAGAMGRLDPASERDG